MITLQQYVGVYKDHPDLTPARLQNAQTLLSRSWSLEAEMARLGVKFPDNPKTKSGVSGTTDGGFRPQNCATGAKNSPHKEGMGMDRYDPDGKIDDWCMAHQDRLAVHGIWIEHPSATPGWSHWQSRAVPSGNRVFYP